MKTAQYAKGGGVRCATGRLRRVGHPAAQRCPVWWSLPTDRQHPGSWDDSIDRPTLSATPETSNFNAESSAGRGGVAGESCSAKQGSCWGAAPVRLTRRGMAVLLLAAGTTTPAGSHGGLPSLCGPAQARPPPPRPLPPCNGPLGGQLAAALTRAVYSSVVELQVMDEADFHRETFKLREREYRYYAEANRAQLPRVPDLADNTGGLSNPSYFNFISYCLWKVVYRHVTTPQARETFARTAAAAFLAKLGPDLAQRTPAEGADGPVPAVGAAPDVVIRTVVIPFLELLRTGGYICSYQVVLGSHPGTWPQDWMLSQPVMLVESTAEDEDVGAALQASSAAASGASAQEQGAASAGRDDVSDEFLFQLKLHRPADILGSVALRSEEGGAWPHTVSCCLQLLMERMAGFRAAWEPEGVEPSGQQLLQWQGLAGGIGGAAEHGVAECDEFFYQDQWQGPKRLADKVLLFFGDPLEKVGVDFVPTTLVQNWRLRELERPA